MMTYTIAYIDRTETADSIGAARLAVRDAAIRTYESASAADRVVFVRCEDAIYCYRDRAAADADETGTLAFATIDLHVAD